MCVSCELGGRQGDGLFDESDEMFLEVVEDGFFARRVLGFMDAGSVGVILGQVGDGEVVGLLNGLGGRVAVQEGLFVQKLLNGILLEGQIIQVAVGIVCERVVAFGVVVVEGRHIFDILGICISKHYNSTLHHLEFMH